MALSPEDLEQVRGIVRSEMSRSSGSAWKPLLNVFGGFAIVFCVVLGLHILVIGGFTVYHLMHH
jgi:hypothetical protein